MSLESALRPAERPAPWACPRLHPPAAATSPPHPPAREIPTVAAAGAGKSSPSESSALSAVAHSGAENRLRIRGQGRGGGLIAPVGEKLQDVDEEVDDVLPRRQTPLTGPPSPAHRAARPRSQGRQTPLTGPPNPAHRAAKPRSQGRQTPLTGPPTPAHRAAKPRSAALTGPPTPAYACNCAPSSIAPSDGVDGEANDVLPPFIGGCGMGPRYAICVTRFRSTTQEWQGQELSRGLTK